MHTITTLVLAGVFAALSSDANAQACVATSAWRVPITIDNSGNANAFTGLEVDVTVDTASLIGSGHMLPDGADIRFSDGSSCLPHTVESGINTPSTLMWVRLADVPASASTMIWMYYGDAAASSVDDPDSTFAFHEDFNDDQLNMTNACGTMNNTIAGGVGSLSWASFGLLLSDAVMPVDRIYTAEAQVNGASGNWPGLYWVQQTSQTSYALLTGSGQARISVSGSSTTNYCDGHNWASPLINYTSAAGLWQLTWAATGDIQANFPTVGPITSTDTLFARDEDLQLALGGISGGTGSMDVDWVRARQLATPEPISSAGPEQPAPVSDMRVTLADSPDPVEQGQSLMYAVSADNLGPDDSVDVTLSLVLPSDTEFVSAAASAGANCTTPAPGASGTIDCGWAGTTASGSSRTLDVTVTVSVTGAGSRDASATTASVVFEPDFANNMAIESTAVAAAADLMVSKDDARTEIVAGASTVYVIEASNAGPDPVVAAALTDFLPPELQNGAWMCLPAQSTGTCPTPDTGLGDLDVVIDLAVGESTRFEMVAEANATPGSNVTNTASIDPPAGTTALDLLNDSASDTNTVIAIDIFADGFETPVPIL